MKNGSILILTFVIILLSSCGAPKVEQTSDTILKVYVSKNGSDQNDGTLNSPYQSIHKALDRAYQSLKNNSKVEILIEEGTYLSGDGLYSIGTITITNKISLKGGWNSDFSEITGKSVIDLTNIPKQAIVIQNTEDVEISGLIIQNSKVFSSGGGGILVRNSSKILISNVVISNSLSQSGGGILLDGVSYSKFYITLIGNTSFGYGGGIGITNSYNNEIWVITINNLASTFGGGIGIINSQTNQIVAISTNNSAGYGGGIAIIGNKSRHNIINGNISFNSGSQSGGGVFISKAIDTTISANIIGNYSPLGGGISIESPQGQIIISESIITNTLSSGASQSVIYISNSTPTTPLIIFNCLIGGTTSNPIYGIYEDGIDISGHSIIRNKFITNTLSYLYRDYTDGDIQINDITTLNIPSTKHDATVGQNEVTNL